MDSDKRVWIYCGLAVAAGVGLVTVAARSSTPPSQPPPGPVPTPQPSQNDSTAFPPIRPGDRLLLIGDSLAQGLSAPLKQLATDQKVAFLGDGRVSTRIDQWAAQPWLAADVTTFGPSFIIVSLGTNDMKLTSPQAEQPALANLVANLKNTGATIVWLTPPTMPFTDNGVRAMLDAAGTTLFRSDSLVISRGPDGIHPTTAGYAGWAGLIWQYLARGGLTTKRRIR